MKLALIRHVMGVALALAFAGSAAAQPADPLPAPTDPVAQVNLGLEREAAGKFEEAVHWYRLAAEQGNASAQNNMAYMLVTGSGIAQDFAAAFEWLKKSAAQGDPAGQNNLGLMYSSGQGVDRDFAEAVRWYGLAAEQGMALAQLNLATLYSNGRGVEQDQVQAHLWYSLAAEQGMAAAATGREFVESLMTAEQIEEARRVAREWQPKGR